MATVILQSGYEDSIRTRLGVKASDLPDADINDKFVAGLAEAYMIKRVPDYASITDLTDSLYLQNAVVSYICFLLIPSMPRRVKTQVQTLDVSWRTDKTDWDKLGMDLLSDMELSLTKITSVSVDTATEIVIMDIAKRSS